MGKNNFFEEVALACKDDATKVRQTMYLIMHGETTMEQTKKTMTDLVVSKFMEKINDSNLLELFNSKIGYKDRELSQPAEKTLIYELISTSLSFPQKEKGFMLCPVGHYFREEDLSEIFVDCNSFSWAINKMNENCFAGEKIMYIFKGPNTRGGIIELYFVGGQCLMTEIEKKTKKQFQKKLRKNLGEKS